MFLFEEHCGKFRPVLQTFSFIFSYFNDVQVFVENQIYSLKQQRIKIINEYYNARIATLKESKNSGSVYNPLPIDYLYLSDKEFEADIRKVLICTARVFNKLGNVIMQNSTALNQDTKM